MPQRIIILALLIASLSGCAVNNFLKERREAREQAYITSAQESCKHYGFVEKTDAFAQCIQNEVNAAKARDMTSENAANSTKTSCTKTITGMDCTTQ